VRDSAPQPSRTPRPAGESRGAFFEIDDAAHASIAKIFGTGIADELKTTAPPRTTAPPPKTAPRLAPDGANERVAAGGCGRALAEPT